MEEIYKYLLNHSFLAEKYLGNHTLDYIISFLLVIALYYALHFALKAIIVFAAKFSQKTETPIDDKVIAYFKTGKIRAKLRLIEKLAAFYISINYLNLSDKLENFLDKFAMIVGTIAVTVMIIDFIRFYLEIKNLLKERETHHTSAIYLIFPIIKIFIWTFAAFFILNNLDVDVSKILTALGIGGVAIAFAAQSFLSDILSFISIVSDKPFEIGDYILINQTEGIVTKIGLKSIRINSITGEEVAIPNSVVTASKLQNFRRMERRRVDLSINIPFDVPNEKLRQIPAVISEIISKEADLEFGRSHFSGFSNYSYIFLTVYYIKSNDYMKFMDYQQIVNLRVRQELNQMGIELAYQKQDIRISPNEDSST